MNSLVSAIALFSLLSVSGGTLLQKNKNKKKGIPLKHWVFVSQAFRLYITDSNEGGCVVNSQENGSFL